MFHFEDPSDFDDDWYLGDRSRYSEYIPKNLMKNVSNMHLLSIQFLYENFMKKRGGAILNENEDMNMCLQVCLFLSAVRHKINNDSPVVIVCPEYLLCQWHFHLTEVGFGPKIISVQSEDYNPCKVYLVSSGSVKLCQKLLEWDFFCVVVDDIDSLITKVGVRKFNGGFRIGLTKRNFYMEPDQKLRWMMLNWVSPGCVGKLSDFFKIDRLHSLAFADNYRYWWLRLTWEFCDSFEPPTEDEFKEYQEKLMQWGHENNIVPVLKSNRHKTKRRNTEIPQKSVKRLRKNSENSKHLEIPPSDLVSENQESLKESSMSENLMNQEGNDSKENIEVSEPIKSSSSEDIFTVLTGRKASKNANMESSEEDPILSIISSQPLGVSGMGSNREDDVKPSLSRESDCDFLSEFVRNKSTHSENSRSQKISNLLDNLSDIEENSERSSEDNDFFSEFISGSKIKD